MYVIHILDLAWAIYGQVIVTQDDIPFDCLAGSGDGTDSARHSSVVVLSIDELCLFNLILSSLNAFFWAFFTFLCGPHYHDSKHMFQLRWKSKCECLFSLLTCQRRKKDLDPVFDHLGELFGQLLTVECRDGTYETVEMSDIVFSLNLVRKAQAMERRASSEDLSSLASPIRSAELLELHRYGVLAKAIYGWPVYACYNPLKCCTLFGCGSRSKSSVIRHDNMLQTNRRAFVKHSRIESDDLIYLNCHNDVFESPYAIVRDPSRKEIVLSIRGTLSVTDLLTDGFAKQALLPADYTEPGAPHAVYTHEGILRTAMALFQHLQQGSRRRVFWDFCTANPEWQIVVCGHSLGGGIAAILTLLLRKLFPLTRGYLFGPPPVFNEAAAEWSKCCLQTVVYNDDFVPRLSVSNVTRLRNEMLEQYSLVARKPLYRAYCVNPKPPKQRREASASLVSEMNDRKRRFYPTHDDYMELDLPGQIFHIEPVKGARTCGCRLLCGQQRLRCSRKSARAFKRILVNCRVLPDHMTHHYERDLLHCARDAAEQEQETEAAGMYHQVV